MRLGNVQGSPINHILEQSASTLERFYSQCGITNKDVVTLTRTSVERPMCGVCERVKPNAQ